ncbi:hypothetical protein ACN2XU_02655 [Primorskyibacter sp. 2E107]|uniref:hypothetical protein n=1 Tax=Primorskyibacter sp. 2E107 TaxID=3403458 RepID=UPI003AF8F880
MATEVHPITGDELNPIAVKRAQLTFENAVTAWIMKLQGETFTDIVQKLGTNANRIGEVFRGDAHRDAHAKAVAILRKHKSLLV